MFHELIGRKNISKFGNVLTLKITLRNKIPGNDRFSKVTRA